MANTVLPKFDFNGPKLIKGLKEIRCSYRKFAEMLGVNERTARIYLKTGKIPTHRLNKFKQVVFKLFKEEED